MERRREPSGHSGCDSAHTIAVPGFGVGREGNAFFDRRNLRTRFAWRTSGNHPLNASARIVVRLLIPPAVKPSADSKAEPFAFRKARIFARRMFNPSRSR